MTITQFLVSLLLSFFIQNPAKKLTITGFENDKGKAFVEILNEKNEAVKRLVLPINHQQVSVVLTDLSENRYAIKVFHDENNNKKLDFNLLGMPTEAWGVSNNARPSFRAPTLQEMLVDIVAKNEIIIKVK